MPLDLIVVAQKAVSKAEDRFVDLRGVEPSSRALELARTTAKDARLVELILRESSEVLRARSNVLIVRHRLGFVLAQAGIDRSNVPGDERVLLLPVDPDASAQTLRSALRARFGVEVGVVMTHSFGRPWRVGNDQRRARRRRRPGALGSAGRARPTGTRALIDPGCVGRCHCRGGGPADGRGGRERPRGAGPRPRLPRCAKPGPFAGPSAR